MRKSSLQIDRRGFIKTSTTLTAGLAGFSLFPLQACSMDNADEGINVIGPKEGFSPQIGTLVSMMNWMRMAILQPVHNMTIDQLDYLHDAKANTIGAMLLHLAATEKYYQLHTFEGMKWGTWDDSINKQWQIPSRLGEDAARGTISRRSVRSTQRIRALLASAARANPGRVYRLALPRRERPADRLTAGVNTKAVFLTGK